MIPGVVLLEKQFFILVGFCMFIFFFKDISIPSKKNILGFSTGFKNIK